MSKKDFSLEKSTLKIENINIGGYQFFISSAVFLKISTPILRIFRKIVQSWLTFFS